jgi:uncharacterized protein YhfF
MPDKGSLSGGAAPATDSTVTVEPTRSDHSATAAMWAAYSAATGVTGSYTAWGFADGSNPALRTKLGLLVRDGPKRATAGRETDFTDAEPIPSPGDHHVILDGGGRPLCIIRTTSVEIRPFGQVDAQFAWDEGEGDRTLPWWRDAHRRYFAGVGTPIDDETHLVLERFAKVWPEPVDPVR